VFVVKKRVDYIKRPVEPGVAFLAFGKQVEYPNLINNLLHNRVTGHKAA
jgi:hypothetical protein